MKKALLIIAAAVSLSGIGSLGYGNADTADLPSQHSMSSTHLADLPSQHSGDGAKLADLPSQHSAEDVKLADLPSQHSEDNDLV